MVTAGRPLDYRAATVDHRIADRWRPQNAPQKEMRMAEVKRVRKRVSMKALLPKKIAEAAEREKKPPEVGAPSKRPSMGVDD